VPLQAFRDDDLRRKRERGDLQMVTNLPLSGREATEKLEWSTAEHEPGVQPVQSRPEARDQARNEARPGGEARKTQKSARLENPMRLADHCSDVLLGQKVEHEGGNEPIVESGRFLLRRTAVGENDLHPRGERGKSTSGKTDHRGTNIDRSVGRVRAKVLGEKT
jgi:hypothetical protein